MLYQLWSTRSSLGRNRQQGGFHKGYVIFLALFSRYSPYHLGLLEYSSPYSLASGFWNWANKGLMTYCLITSPKKKKKNMKCALMCTHPYKIWLS